jgi:hypothetical protein
MSGISWDDLEDDKLESNQAAEPSQEDDFLSGVTAQEAPKACKIDEPDCEACQ